MCKLKERSRRELCNVRNANGNLLDAAICEQVKHLADHSSDFMKQLEKAKSAHAGNHSEFETKLSTLRKEQAETQRKINALIDSLADFSDSTAAVHLKKAHRGAERSGCRPELPHPGNWNALRTKAFWQGWNLT